MSLLLRLMRSLGRERKTSAPTLYDIFLRNTRKDVTKWHHYFDIYEQYFVRHRGDPVTLLEIGVSQGGSLRMWSEYFGSSARIYGIDIQPGAARYERNGVRIFIGDQADRSFLREVRDEIGPIDIVLDDGGHKMSQQIVTFEELYPVTKHLYVVEDTHSSYWPEFQDGPCTFVDYARAKVDALYEWHLAPESRTQHRLPPHKRPSVTPVSEFCASTRAIHFYDSVIVFEKGDNPPRWNEVR